MLNTKPKISWEAPEFRHYEKSPAWYTLVAIAAVIIIGYFVFFEQDFFAAATILIMTIVALYFATHLPQTVLHELTSTGVRIGTFFFPYRQIKHFWLVDTEHHNTLNFITNTAISREIVLELGDQDQETIREFLLQYLPEHPEPLPTVSQRISHFFRF